MSEKKNKIGMFGGKFLPFHAGHEFCLKTATEECETVFCILFINGEDERRINPNPELKAMRKFYMERAIKKYGAIGKIIDIENCVYPDGTDDWDAMTPLVREVVGDKLDVVYTSEIKDIAYYNRAYPEAEVRLVDPERKKFPVSGTKIREILKKEGKI